jgi:hypothetical protein
LAVGGWRLAVGGWRLAVGGWRLAVDRKIDLQRWFKFYFQYSQIFKFPNS